MSKILMVKEIKEALDKMPDDAPCLVCLGDGDTHPITAVDFWGEGNVEIHTPFYPGSHNEPKTMTRQLRDKFDSLLEGLPDRLRKRAESKIRQGAVNLDEPEGSFILPKLLLISCLKDEIIGWMPQDKEHLEIIKNLDCF